MLTLMRRMTAVALPLAAVPKMVPMGLPSQTPCGEYTGSCSSISVSMTPASL